MNSDQLATLVRLARIGLATLSERQSAEDASNCWRIVAAAEAGVATLAASERRAAEAAKTAEADPVVDGPAG